MQRFSAPRLNPRALPSPLIGEAQHQCCIICPQAAISPYRSQSSASLASVSILSGWPTSRLLVSRRAYLDCVTPKIDVGPTRRTLYVPGGPRWTPKVLHLRTPQNAPPTCGRARALESVAEGHTIARASIFGTSALRRVHLGTGFALAASMTHTHGAVHSAFSPAVESMGSSNVLRSRRVVFVGPKVRVHTLQQ